jgi:hypothetical protein
MPRLASPPGQKAKLFIGLDLGQMADYTALAVVQKREERRPRPPADSAEWGYLHRSDEVTFLEYQLRHLERLPLGTPYTEVAKRVRQVQTSEPVASAKSYVVVDVTGVGLPVFEMLKGAGVEDLHGVSIHAGDAVTRDGRINRVPKRDLVSTLQVLLQGGKLKFAEGLPDGEVLRHELQSFRAKINLATGHDSYEAWREGDHDDLVLALALACWFAENREPRDWSEPRSIAFSFGRRL